MSDSETKSGWDRVAVRVTVMSALVVVASTLLGMYVVFKTDVFGPSAHEAEALRDPAAVASRQVIECMADHVMSQPRSFTDDQGKTRQAWTKREIVFRRCDWPPVGPTSVDGYTEVPVTIVWIPDKGGADLFDQVDTVRTPCADTRVTFALVHMAGCSAVEASSAARIS